MADTLWSDLLASSPTNEIQPTDGTVLVRAGLPKAFNGTLPTIDGSGAVGVNVPTPSVTYSARMVTKAKVGEAALAVDADVGTNAGINFYLDGVIKYTLQAVDGGGGFRLYDFTLGTEMIRASAGGAVTIRSGTTASGANLFQSASGDQIVRSTSSKRYKRDIEALEPARADAILAARPVWYRSTADADNPAWGYYGLIAEEVAELDPRLVHWGYQEDQYERVRVSPARRGRQAKIDAHGNEIVPAVPAAPPVYETRLKEGADLRPDGVQYDRLTVLLLDIVRRQEDRIAALEAAIDANHNG